MKAFLFTILSIPAFAQNESCPTAIPLTTVCSSFPFTPEVTRCYTFTTQGDSVHFSWLYTANCSSLLVEYTLFDSLCNALDSTTTGLFTITPGDTYTVCGTVTCMDPGGIIQLCPFELLTLPVELVDMFWSVDVNGAMSVEWIVSGERDVSHYRVLASPDMTAWTWICSVPAVGNVHGEVSYRCGIPAQDRSIYYYRLDRADMDGTTETITTIVVRFPWIQGITTMDRVNVIGQKIR